LHGFTELLDKLKALYGQAKSILNALAMDKTLFTEDKKQSKDQLILKTVEVSGMIRAYAVIQENSLLEQQMKLAKSNLALLTDLALSAKVEEVLGKAAELSPNLTDYGVNQELTDSLSAQLGRFNLNLPQVRNNISDHKHSLEEMQRVMDNGDVLLKKMDALMEIIRYSNASVYSDYRNRRKVIETGHRKRSLHLWVTDDTSTEPVSKASVTIHSKNHTELPKVVKSSGPKGGVFVDSLDAGEYSFEVSFNGYQTTAGTFFVNDGIRTDLTVHMSKNP
jgi:hypothetical protein